MGCKVKRYKKSYLKVIETIKNYSVNLKKQNTQINESYINNNSLIRIGSNLREIAEDVSFNPIGFRCLRKSKKKYITESSLINQPTLDSEPVLQKVIDSVNFNQDVLEGIDWGVHYDDQKVFDYIQFLLSSDRSDEELQEMFITIDKIMTACGYFLAVVPKHFEGKFSSSYEMQNNRDIENRLYIIQYEPYNPDPTHISLPDNLYHITTIKNSELIAENGFIPGKNDYFNYPPRIYFAEEFTPQLIAHFLRRHIKDTNFNPVDKSHSYALIEIKTPEDIDFYVDYHMRNVNSFFTLTPIDKSYIIDIRKCKEYKSFNIFLNQIR